MEGGRQLPGASQEWHTAKQKNNSNTNKYHLERKTIKEVSEELKQRITATAKKIDRYDARIKQFRQNQQFSTNQQRFYQSLTETMDNLTNMPEKDDVTQFWRNIWDYTKEHNHNAQWIQNAQKELGRNTMEDVVITEKMVKKQAKKMKNWTAPGKDEVYGFWIKHLTSLHPRIAQQLNRLLETATVEE